MDETQPPYRVQPGDDHFQVVDPAGRVMLDCGNRESAEQYALLLNQAFQRGFKAGFRAGKRG
ncbi:MAG: hypothetical protein ACRED1_06745 [Limisphaerales bacterium]